MITESEAAIIKGMLSRGDHQHDIAAYFGVNPGRISEIHKGDRYPEVVAQNYALPPAGPYSFETGSCGVTTLALRAVRKHGEQRVIACLQSLLAEEPHA